MKRIVLILIVLVGLSIGFAQNLKIAYVNTDRILAGSNEANEIARIYDLDRQNWMNQIKSLNDEIKQMERNYEIDKLTKNEAAKRDAQAKISSKKELAKGMLEEYFGDGGKAEQRYKELIEPLTKKISDVIKKISEDDKYSMVFDVSLGTVLYADSDLDITDRILAELNKDNPRPVENPLQPGMNPPEDKPNQGTSANPINPIPPKPDEFKPDPPK
jgi:Skp family chaperone for outer membrane proteins